MPFAVITDATSSLGDEHLSDQGTPPAVVPSPQCVGLWSVPLNVSETTDRAVTSQPSLAQVSQVMRAACEAGATSVVCPVISARISGTGQAFTAAAQELGIDHEVIDTRVVGGALGLAALAALRGTSPAQAAALAREVAAKSTTTLMVTDLKPLVKGGRLSAPTASVGALLGIVPVIDIRDGQLRLSETVRGKKRARARLVGRLREQLTGSSRVPNRTGQIYDVVVHSPEPEFPEAVRSACEQLPVRTVYHWELPAVLQAHTGPDCWAIAAAPAMR